jgi:hypothetical protein
MLCSRPVRGGAVKNGMPNPASLPEIIAANCLPKRAFHLLLNVLPLREMKAKKYRHASSSVVKVRTLYFLPRSL